MDDRFFVYIGHELAHVNDHLPEKKISLKELAAQKVPQVKTKAGEHYFDRKDINFLKTFVPKEFWRKISLPLIIFRKREAYAFEGNTYECFLIKKLLEGEEYTSEAVIETERTLTLYTPQVTELKRKYKSLFVIGFSV